MRYGRFHMPVLIKMNLEVLRIGRKGRADRNPCLLTRFRHDRVPVRVVYSVKGPVDSEPNLLCDVRVEHHAAGRLTTTRRRRTQRYVASARTIALCVGNGKANDNPVGVVITFDASPMGLAREHAVVAKSNAAASAKRIDVRIGSSNLLSSVACIERFARG